VRFALEAQLRDGSNSSTGNAFEGDVGFDYQGLSVDFLGGKITNAVAVGTTLTTQQVNQLTANQLGSAGNGLGYAIPCAFGCLSAVTSDDTVFQIFAKYTIGAWKIYGGYEHIQFANPNNPLQPGAFTPGGYNLAFVNNNQYLTDRNQHVFWIGAKYAITPTLDIAASYYGIRQESFTVGAGPNAGGNPIFFSVPGSVPGLVNGVSQAAACAINSAASAGCSGAVDQVGLVLDWRFARHVDFYAGIGYTQKSGGLLAGFVTSTNNGALSGNGVNSRASTYTPGAGLRYQF
jgi:predicted porin